jgi:hypothetical protein
MQADRFDVELAEQHRIDEENRLWLEWQEREEDLTFYDDYYLETEDEWYDEQERVDYERRYEDSHLEDLYYDDWLDDDCLDPPRINGDLTDNLRYLAIMHDQLTTGERVELDWMISKAAQLARAVRERTKGT